MNKIMIPVAAIALLFYAAGCGGNVKKVRTGGGEAVEVSVPPAQTVDIYKSVSIITPGSGQAEMEKLPPAPDIDLDYFYTDWIKNRIIPQDIRQAGFFTPGITYYADGRCKIESVLYVVPDRATYEYLVIYDPQGQPLDILLIGTIDTAGRIHGSSAIEGDRVVYIWREGEGSRTAVYKISPGLRFVREE